jgi:REP element-mobilizing transposase RayT
MDMAAVDMSNSDSDSDSDSESKAGSKRARKRHVQQALFRHGGKRRGAGRKPRGPRSSAAHKTRPEVEAKNVLHVVLRAAPEVGNLRQREIYKAIRAASRTVAQREEFRIVHLSIQRTHVHLLVEAEDKLALARGMQGFQISAARHINTALRTDPYRRRRGPVFADRYHLVVITSPTQARHVLAYVLGNWRKHREDQHGLPATWLIDPYSSACSFPGWKELRQGGVTWTLPPTYEPLVVSSPRSWLLTEGWKRAGAISIHEVPSSACHGVRQVRRPQRVTTRRAPG